ncbi:MAG: glycosyltransferase family protein [Rhodospirillales bacterium]|nr:glycosyltransferase family protein [Rhodospirillales bacterium]
MSKTVAIVQARMGSSRLPGKVLMNLAGRTVLSHVLERCQAIDGVDSVCCAIPQGVDNDPVADEAEVAGAIVFRGSENDVLDRYYKAALALGADVVLRVTSDCPLIDPAVCADVLRLRQEEKADFATNNMPPSWPHGLDCEVFTFEWLTRAADEATQQEAREHVGPYVRNHAEARKVNLASPDASLAGHRWTLDTADDFEILTGLFARLPEGSQGWGYQAVLDKQV